ncbi:hypothetical protein KTR9_0940 [Gordonia sp. KTR9]|nr:hypothetical protein KTR9_0940 [Gordonia sp. KTR9]
MHLPPGLRALARDHDGLITAAQAREHDLDRWAVRRRVAAGDWIRVGPRLYRLADHPATERTRARIATLSVGPRAVLSGLAAAWWLGVVDELPVVMTVTAPRSRHGGAVMGVRIVHRTLADADLLVRSDLRVTGIALSVLEGAVESGVEVIDAALQKHLSPSNVSVRPTSVGAGASALSRWGRRLRCWKPVHGRLRSVSRYRSCATRVSLAGRPTIRAVGT